MANMLKVPQVRQIQDVVTMAGSIELSPQDVFEILTNLAPKVREAATNTEKSTMYLHENIKRFGLDLLSLSKTAENIQDSFHTLLRTCYIDEQQSTEAKKFYKSSMETFSALGSHMSTISQYMAEDCSKVYEYISLEGGRIGQMQRLITEITHEHDKKLEALKLKQQKLFKQKDIPKWNNADVGRMVAEDQKELIKDKNNMGLILPDEQ